ncbi:hypothetical protein L1D19_19565 [Vibrio natriegens]|uniref:hypothetical protein n=1 Tax=Vibrio natriegens TaxID=691 RepID=UPI001EFCDB6C|nr:hypothetical protein [Vibrio natriegens]MCG9702276.1 hypothetical protein [Vibrio natriegens]
MSMLFENNEREEQRLLGGLILAFGIGLSIFSMALSDYRIPEPPEPEETMQLVVAPDMPVEKPKPAPKPKEKPLTPKPQPKPKPKDTSTSTMVKPKAETQKPAAKPTPNATAGGGSASRPSVSQPAVAESTKPKDAAAELGAMFGAQQTTSSNANTYKAPTASSGNGVSTARNVSSSSTSTTATKPLVVGSQTVSQSLTQVAAAKPTGSGAKTRNSAVLEREISSESGAVDRDITALFFGLKAEIRQQVVSYGIRNQTLRFTVNLSQGQVTSITVAGIPSDLQSSLNRLLSGRRINSTFTGVKSHVVMVN